MKNSSVIFDMDGLMFDTEALSTKAWLHVGEVLKIHLPVAFINSFKGMSAKYSKVLFQERFGQNFDYDSARQMRTEYMMSYMRTYGVPIKEGLKELLVYLQEHSVKVALATSSTQSYAQWLLEETGVKSYFDVMIFGDSVKTGKPEPEIFLTACKQLKERTQSYAQWLLEETGVKSYFDVMIFGDSVKTGKPEPEIFLTACKQLKELPHQCIVLEDSPIGVEAAYKAGCQVFVVPDQIKFTENELVKVDRCFNSLQEVLQYFRTNI